MSKMRDQFDGFTLHLSQVADHEWLAHFVELPGVSAYGDSAEEVLTELETIWIAMKESYIEHHEPIPVAPSRKNYSGQFNVRLDKRLHRALAVEAAQFGLSLNALVSQKLSNSSHIA